jgi:hypothetical protein
MVYEHDRHLAYYLQSIFQLARCNEIWLPADCARKRDRRIGRLDAGTRRLAIIGAHVARLSMTYLV